MISWDTSLANIPLLGMIMASFCISFGIIYSLIFCYKSRRKQGAEEEERVREELLKDKQIPRRKSTSLSSPPLSDSVVNANYSPSPLKVPQRHLRSTSASYSPTHYLSPHHHRNSTPTQQEPTVSNNVSVAGECSCCGCPRGINPPSITSSSSPEDCCCKEDFLLTHKSKLIPVQKSFTFGPIPAARRARSGCGLLPSKLVNLPPTNIKMQAMKGMEMDEKKPLLWNKKEEKMYKAEKENEEVKGCNNNSKRVLPYTHHLFKKENMVMEEIPFYLDNCNQHISN